MDSSFRLLRVRGIDIGANWSWLLIFAFIIWTLATGIFPSVYPGLEKSTYLVMGVVTAVLFQVSLLLHELGHAFRAQRDGMEIEGITLWFFGGVAKFKGMFPTAGAEFRIAIAGPIVTVVLIAVFLGLTLALSALDAPASVLGIVDYLWTINLVLLVFNMIPALPLDGGRVLRSALWQRKGNFAEATIAAVRVARFFAGLMIAAGILGLLVRLPVGGPFLAFIGFFLLQAARAEEAYAVFSQGLSQSLGNLRVGDLMTPDPTAVDPDRTIASFLDDFAFARGHSTYPVVGPMGELLGLMSLRRAAEVSGDARGTTAVRDVMLPREDVPVLDVGADIPHAMTKLQEAEGRAVVLSMSRPVGILSMADIAKAVELDPLHRPDPVPAEPERRARGGSRRALWITLGIVSVALVALLYAPPYVVITPGAAFDVTPDITITGVETDEVDGKYLLTSVAVAQPNLLGLIVSMAQGNDILPESALVPPDIDPEEYFKQQEALFKEAQLTAAAAAAKAAGLPVTLDGEGALVRSLVPDKPASKVLRADDVIVEIDREPVRLADDFIRRIRSRPSGSEFTLRVRRGKGTRTVKLATAEGIVEGAPGIGAMLETKNFDVKLPFKIKFRKREIGGPSAGLSYALAVYDILDPKNVARGRVVATTGTMDLDGNVGPIGGIEEKSVAAKREKAGLFIVPEAEVEGARGAGLDVRGVRTLKDALQVLRSTA